MDAIKDHLQIQRGLIDVGDANLEPAVAGATTERRFGNCGLSNRRILDRRLREFGHRKLGHFQVPVVQRGERTGQNAISRSGQTSINLAQTLVRVLCMGSASGFGKLDKERLAGRWGSLGCGCTCCLG